MSRDAERLATSDSAGAETARSTTADPIAGAAPAAAVLALQRGAGNRATARMVAAVLARDTPAAMATRSARERVDAVLRGRDPAAVNGLGSEDLWEATDDQRRWLIHLMLTKATWNAFDASTVSRIWGSYGDSRTFEMAAQGPTFVECQRRGAIMSRLLLDEEVLLQTYTRPGVLTPHQCRRARRILDGLGGVDFGMFRWTLHQAESDLERAYLFKALAAGRTIDHIVIFARIIRGKSDSWLMRWLNLTGASTAAGGGTGIGVTQQFAMSCGPTSVQTVRAENDPIFALWMRQGGTITGVASGNTRLSGGQQTILTAAGGTAVARPSSGGTGAWVETSAGGLSSLSGVTGVTYSRVLVTAVTPTNPANGAVDSALRTIGAWLDYGVQVPIVIGASIGATTHYVVVLSRQGTNFIIHDPWNGVTVTVTRNQFMTNSLSPPMPGGLSILTAYSRPRLVP